RGSRVRPRHASGDRIGRGAVRGWRRVPVRLPAGILFGAVRFLEQLQPVAGPDAPEKGSPEAVATQERTPDSAVTRQAINEVLAREPWRFGFFQAVRLLHALHPERAKIGFFEPPETEAVRFAVHPSLAFPASEIQTLDLREGQPARMQVNFMGLTGPLA